MATSLKAALNIAWPDTLADKFRKLAIGDILRALEAYLWRKAPVATADHLATLAALVLPDDAKAVNIARATALVGTATAGELVVDLYGTTPATGHVAVAPNGDIQFLLADAWTSVDVVYRPMKQDVVTVPITVVPGTGIGALPTTVLGRGVVSILGATQDAGTVTGTDIVIVPSNTVPATTKQVNLNLAKTQVQFRIADAVTAATVKLGLVPATDVDALLEADSDSI